MTGKLMLSANKRHVLDALDIPRWQLRQTEAVIEPVARPQSGLESPSKPMIADIPVDRPLPGNGSPDPTVIASPSIDELNWSDLYQRVAGCHACGLSQQRTQTVFGVGDQSADWLIVGEAPGQEEDQRGEPFVGRAGQLLDNMLQAIGLARSQVYITNIVKCRPPGNRDPHVDERDACRGYLKRQIALLRPKIIVVVGRVAAHALLETEEAVGKLRGGEFNYGTSEIPLVVTYHPAYLLRSPSEKSKAWSDLCFARERYNAVLAKG